MNMFKIYQGKKHLNKRHKAILLAPNVPQQPFQMQLKIFLLWAQYIILISKFINHQKAAESHCSLECGVCSPTYYVEV